MLFWNKIRRFGLEYCDLPTMISNVNYFLRMVAVNIDSRNNKPVSLFSRLSTLFAIICYVYVYVFSTTWFVLYKSRETGDLVAASIILSTCIPSDIGTVKLIFIFYYQRLLSSIVSQYLACDAVAMGNRFFKNLHKTLRTVKKRAMIYWIALMLNGVAYVIKPFLMPGRHLSEDRFIIYGLEPMLESPNYEMATGIMAIGVFITCFTAGSITGFLVIMVGYTEAQMNALSEEMLNLWQDAVDYCNKNDNLNVLRHFDHDDTISHEATVHEHVNKRLIVIIKRHAINMSLIRQIEAVFRVPIAVGFLLLSLGLLAELLGGLENTYLQLPFALVQVGMDCYVGQKVMDASIKFEGAVANCRWENFDKCNMRIVLVMLQSAQKTMMLSAGSITNLNFVTMMSVLKSIYSAYTTLRSFIR